MKASVIITTKNRKDDLRRAIISCLTQRDKPELIIIDDGSSDGTSEFVREKFPEVRLIRSDRSLGCIAQRNRAAKLASGDILFSIDDDAEFSSPDIVSETMKEFDHARIAVVAIPYLEPQKSSKEFQRAPGTDHTYVMDSFVGTAHALRKDVFLKLGGFREGLVHQGEESDYCLRLLDAGYVVRLGNSDPIFHLEAANRDWSRMDYYGARNTVLFAYQNVPLPYLPFHLAAASWNVAKLTLEPSRFAYRLKAIGDAYQWCLRNRSERRPVAASSYLLFRRLRKKGPLHLAEVEPLLDRHTQINEHRLTA
jgi:GT2 family glycosyltransferase